VSLGGSIGIIAWSQWLLPNAEVIEPRHPVESAADPAAEREILGASPGHAPVVPRQASAGVRGAGAALAVPVLSLGPAPGRSLYETSWRAGTRLVGLDGEPIRADALLIDGV
jgi:hypothetical protein